jgi:hypothetical protein
MFDNPLLWLLIAVAAAVLVSLIALSLRSGSREKRAVDANQNPRPPSAAQSTAEPGQPPYGIDERPAPTSDNLDDLLPANVGVFARKSLTVDNPKGPIYADYAAGRQKVFVELGICGEPGAARRALSTAKAETDAEFPDTPQQASLGAEPSFLKTSNRLGAFMAWTRGGYYFSAHARGGEADLDQFMESFPY